MQTLSLSHTHAPVPRSLSPSLSASHTRALSLSHTHARALTQSLSLFLTHALFQNKYTSALCLSLTNSHTNRDTCGSGRSSGRTDDRCKLTLTFHSLTHAHTHPTRGPCRSGKSSGRPYDRCKLTLTFHSLTHSHTHTQPEDLAEVAKAVGDQTIEATKSNVNLGKEISTIQISKSYFYQYANKFSKVGCVYIYVTSFLRWITCICAFILDGLFVYIQT